MHLTAMFTKLHRRTFSSGWDKDTDPGEDDSGRFVYAHSHPHQVHVQIIVNHHVMPNRSFLEYRSLFPRNKQRQSEEVIII